MFSPKLALEIMDILERFMSEGRQFTCFDVTRELKSLGQQPRHRDVRDFVHGMGAEEVGPFMTHDYQRSTKTFTTDMGITDTAEVYHEVNDTSDYDPDQDKRGKVVDGSQQQNNCMACGKVHHGLTSGTFTAPTVSSVITSTSGPQVTNTTDGNRHKVDNRGRICVRKNFVEALGVSPGERVYLQRTQDGDIVVSRSVPQTNYIGNLKVDKDGNVRVTRHLQGKAGITADEFAMELKNGSVVLTA